MKLTATMSVLLGLAVLSQAAVADGEKTPANVQDPPGQVGVEQPAGVTFDQRDTIADVTDTMLGARTEVIESTPGRADDRLPLQWANESSTASRTASRVEPGSDVRAAFEQGADTSRGEPATGVPAEDTYLGTDLGYGTGTEPVLIQ